jgi:hypothetical protein
MKSLVEILRNSPTDKLQNGFAEFYDDEFGMIREEVANVLEIGIAVGGSLRGWLEFFPNAHVYALDNNPQAVATTTHRSL